MRSKEHDALGPLQRCCERVTASVTSTSTDSLGLGGPDGLHERPTAVALGLIRCAGDEIGGAHRPTQLPLYDNGDRPQLFKQQQALTLPAPPRIWGLPQNQRFPAQGPKLEPSGSPLDGVECRFPRAGAAS